MRCVEGDLSGKKQLQVRLWLKMGQGDGVVTDVRIQKAPPNHTNPAVAKVHTHHPSRMRRNRKARNLNVCVCFFFALNSGENTHTPLLDVRSESISPVVVWVHSRRMHRRHRKREYINLFVGDGEIRLEETA